MLRTEDTRLQAGRVKKMKKSISGWVVVLAVVISALAIPAFARTWNDADFDNRPLFGYPIPKGHDDIIGATSSYKIQPGDTLLDVGRWFGLSAKEVSEANGRLDWWSPGVGKEIVLPSAHILPEGPRSGIVMNIPEMRLYYYYPSPVYGRHRGKLTPAAISGSSAQVVYTFPVGLGRFDWKTPVGAWTVVARTKDPTWVVPEDIYQEHLERDGEADHMVLGGDPDNPLGRFRLSLSLPEYAIHGTDVPWGVGMNISHGCIRLYPEDIERLFEKVKVGTPGRFVYQPVKFGWRGDALYVEVHDDLYAKFPGLWNHAAAEVRRLGLEDDVDTHKLEQAVEAKSGVPTYVMPGPEPTADTIDAAVPAYAMPPVNSGTAAVAAPANNDSDDDMDNGSGGDMDNGNGGDDDDDNSAG